MKLRYEVGFGVVPVLRIPSCQLPVHNPRQFSVLYENVAHVEIAVGKDNPMSAAVNDVRQSTTSQNRASSYSNPALIL